MEHSIQRPLPSLIERYKRDPESVYHTWFVGGEARMKAFGAIRRGVNETVGVINANTFGNDFGGSPLEVVLAAGTEQKQVFAGAAHPYYWKPKLRIPDICENDESKRVFGRFLGACLSATREDEVLAEMSRLRSASIKGLGSCGGQHTLVRVGRAPGYDVFVARKGRHRSCHADAFSELTIAALPDLDLSDEVRQTVELIGVIRFVKGRSELACAFEVEQGTSIYTADEGHGAFVVGAWPTSISLRPEARETGSGRADDHAGALARGRRLPARIPARRRTGAALRGDVPLRRRQVGVAEGRAVARHGW